MSKQTADVHSNYVVDAPVKRQPYLELYLIEPVGSVQKTTLTLKVGQPTLLCGFLLLTPTDIGYYGVRGTVNIQYLNSDGNTWTTFDRIHENYSYGEFYWGLTPTVAGVYTMQATYDGNGQYASAVSNTVTLTVTNVAIS